MKTEKLILSSAYFGPVQYFTRFVSSPEIIIEQFDNYCKQTYRNRCVIYGHEGPLILSIPVKRKRNDKTVLKDIRIDYDTDWRRMHIRSIISCYNSSPYFHFLRDDIEPFFKKKYGFLIDLNMEITLKMSELMNLNSELTLSSAYNNCSNNPDIKDLRQIINPKISLSKDPSFIPKPYHQVFSYKLGFIPNLSILDLLLNTGPEAKLVLKKSIKER